MKSLNKLLLPNFLSMCRLLLLLVYLLIFRHNDTISLVIAASVLVLCSITDMLDGFIARRLHIQSDMGEILDSAVDSLVRNTVFITFVSVGAITPWMAASCLLRDGLLWFIKPLGLISGGDLPRKRFSGKVNAVGQGISIGGILAVFLLAAANNSSFDSSITYKFMIIGVVTSFVSIVDIMYTHRSLFHLMGQVPE
ncbi:MAG TPA: CDP-alcohol phosphatidyltransferase family protein [Bellilinea sp.]|nr:CDP-alcohol phosphatidyltransferase family protein [Bellilinea sp.]